MSGYKTAILAGGCFWGMQDLIRRQPGVVSTRCGYTGGRNANARYRNHPGHAEDGGQRGRPCGAALPVARRFKGREARGEVFGVLAHDVGPPIS